MSGVSAQAVPASYLIDMDRDFQAFNRVYAEYFGSIEATRTTVQIDRLPTPIAGSDTQASALEQDALTAQELLEQLRALGAGKPGEVDDALVDKYKGFGIDLERAALALHAPRERLPVLLESLGQQRRGLAAFELGFGAARTQFEQLGVVDRPDLSHLVALVQPTGLGQQGQWWGCQRQRGDFQLCHQYTCQR